MISISVITLFLAIYILTWFSLIIGVSLVKTRNKAAQKMQALFVSKQIQKFRYPPFKNLLNLWVARKYLPATFTFITIIIIPAAFMYFSLGILLISPILAVFQGLTVGLLIADLKGKNMTWAIVVLIFEFGYWAFSGAFGMLISIQYLTTDQTFVSSFVAAMNSLTSGYWIPLVVGILGNAFLEIAGPIYWDMKGAINLEAIAEGQGFENNT